MSDQRNHIDHLLRDKFLSFEGNIPVSDWNAIADKLESKRRIGWIWWAAIPLIVISGLSYLLVKNHHLATLKFKTINTPSAKVTPYVKADQPELLQNEVKTKSFHKKPKNITGSPAKVMELNKAKSLMEETYPLAFEGLNMVQIGVHNLFAFTQAELQKNPELNLPKPEFKHKTPKVIEFGASFSPTAGLDAIKGNGSNLLNRNFFNAVNGSSSFGNGYNNGIHVQLNLNKNWFIRQGLYGSAYSVMHDFNYTITESPHITDGKGIVYYNPLLPSEYEHIKASNKASVKYVSLPLTFGYRHYIKPNFGLESKFGLNLSRLVGVEGMDVNPTHLNLESLNSNNSIKKWTNGVSFSSGLFFKTNNNLIFTVEPNFSTQIGSARTKNYPVKTRFYNYGVNFNINYILNRKSK